MRRIGWLMILGLLLAACAPTVVAPTAVAPTAVPVAPPTSNAPTAAAPTSAPATAEPTVEVQPTEAVEAAPTPHAVKTELAATDPSTVQLAAGQPQLVEFFAFW